MGEVDAGAKKFVGKWKMVSTHNIDEYMKKLGIGWAKRRLASLATKQTLSISVDDSGLWTNESEGGAKDSKNEFRLGEPRDVTTPDGRECSTTVTFENGKMIHRQVPKNDTEMATSQERELNDKANKLTITAIAGDVQCTKTYERIE